ncbi:hypothetical protein [Bacillus thuringiensis]|uniref:hypothetical protein n=1 Tax=Bacillus cereus group TaxID=86661 RepID=UPI000788E6D7|nr:hypothetical protein [Bacillus thuringiensis]AMR88329.1 hypothetical protein A3L20_30445 [Bacillus thuringiensis]MBG9640104.1 hypothetical protein [Bacillus thuringiensis]MBG9670718.1 hypothetical protein [Bacillus thuringiensis]MEC3299223.1 hypothetical protein [Bacillus thuringiensis]MEC3403852.1 hypothetical protein [Bacillus thuringiensis]
MSTVSDVCGNTENLKVLLKTAAQTAKILGVSKQRLGAIKKSGQLQPIYVSTQGDLYLLSDIYSYKNGFQVNRSEYHTKYMIYDLLLKKKKILVVGTIGQGKTHLTQIIKEELSEYMKNISLYDWECEYLFVDMYNDLFNSAKGVIVTILGRNGIEGYKRFMANLSEEKVNTSLSETPNFDVIIEVERGRNYKVIQVDDYFEHTYREMIL